MSRKRKKRLEEIAEERNFLANRLHDRNGTNVSWVGLSSNWMTVWAIGVVEQEANGLGVKALTLVTPNVRWPLDEGDFGRCMATYALAPVHLRPAMWDVLQVFRQYVDRRLAERAAEAARQETGS